MRWVCFSFALFTAGCSSGRADLAEDIVTSLPDGDAQGDSASGTYLVDLTTQSCGGICPDVRVIGIPVQICVQGADFTNQRITITQDQGHLDARISGSTLFVRALAGGIDGDGSFDVGGVTSALNEQVKITARVKGTIRSSGEIEGTARALGRGEADGTTIDCLGTFSVKGKRQGL